jgi:ADP-ribosylglycohydrolase
MNLMKDILYGMAIGDALGVPYEFKTREEMKKNPCTGMIGYGTHKQPKGTWSDDTSLALATVASLVKGYNINDIAIAFTAWRDLGHYAINGKVFDIGGTTNIAIERIKEGKLPVTLCGGYDERSNGNGSLMRILPIVDYILYLKTKTEVTQEEINRIISDLSSLTHRNEFSIERCQHLILFAYYLINSKNKETSFENFTGDPNRTAFKSIFLFNSYNDFINISEKQIKSGGYVLDTLEASIWCLLTTDNYKDAVLKAVNLGGDTDTTACVTGGLAGILYGYENIPKEWIDDLRGKELINSVIKNYDKSKLLN